MYTLITEPKTPKIFFNIRIQTELLKWLEEWADEEHPDKASVLRNLIVQEKQRRMDKCPIK